jgi:ABC-type branched-subunit amino acid transport system substrate-binding protein
MPVRNQRARPIAAALAALTAAWLVSGCISESPKVIKIGFIAPFEGRYREIGDDVIPAARLAVREYASRYPANQLVVELVAYDDQGVAARAVAQARKLVEDPDVAVVIGHWRDETTAAALPVYQQANMPLITFSTLEMTSTSSVLNLSPSGTSLGEAAQQWGSSQLPQARLLAPDGDDVSQAASALGPSLGQAPTTSAIGGPVWGLRQFRALVPDSPLDLYFVTGAAFPTDLPAGYWPDGMLAEFVDGFKKGSLGAPPGMLSVTAYEATWLAIRRAASREGVALGSSPGDDMAFDAAGRRLDAPIYLYRWEGGQARLVQMLP